MSFVAYAFDVIFQALLALNFLQLGVLLLKRWAQKVEDQSSDQAAARYYFSVIFSTHPTQFVFFLRLSFFGSAFSIRSYVIRFARLWTFS